MSHLIQIQWTCGTIDEARRVAKELVEKKLAACVNIIPWVESIYLWDDETQTEQESKVMIKTLRDHFEAIREIIEREARYEVPEILITPIEGGNPSYIEWLESVC